MWRLKLRDGMIHVSAPG